MHMDLHTHDDACGCDAPGPVQLVPPPLSLYVHLPWCVRKCPYCDFNSHAGKGALPFDAYIDALIRDLDQDLPLVWGRVVNSVFFGGGTPSLFPPEAIDRFLQAASARLRFAPNLEVTLETNPGTAEHGRFDRYRAAGVNRISFGIQTFNDEALQRLGRIHDSREAERAVKLAQDAGYNNFNIDLMYALPQQTLAQAEHDLERAFALDPTHISHYQLTLEPNTVFFAKPPQGIPDEDSAWDIQEHCQALLAEHGYGQYEVSAYAREAGNASTTSTTGASATTWGSVPAPTARSAPAPSSRCCAAGSTSTRRPSWTPQARPPPSAAMTWSAQNACRSSTCSICCACTKASRWPISRPAPDWSAACCDRHWIPHRRAAG